MNDDATKRTALTIALISSFITPFMGSGVNVALPTMGREFKIDAVLLSWIATSYILASVISLVPFGRLADIYGRKTTFLWGYIIFTISTFACGVSPNVFMLILSRVVQGIGSAMIFSTGMAILVSVFPPEARGRVLGITVAAVYIGLSLGPFLGGLLTEHLSWRSVFMINVPLGLIIILLVLFKLKGEWAEAKGEKYDIIGAVIYGIGILAFMYGITLLPTFRGLWLILIGACGIAAFFKWETRVESPVFELSLFRKNRVFAFSNLAALINYSSVFAATFLLSLYLQHIKALSPQYAGLVMIAQPVIMAIVSPFAGRLSDRIEPQIVSSIGMAFTTLGLFLLIFLTSNSGLPYIIMSLMILGFGFALFSSPNANAVMSSVERRFFGLASGSLGTMRLLGMMISMGIATLVFTLFIGRVQITPAVYPGFVKSVKTAFLIFTLLGFGGIFASMVRGKLRTGRSAPH